MNTASEIQRQSSAVLRDFQFDFPRRPVLEAVDQRGDGEQHDYRPEHPARSSCSRYPQQAGPQRCCIRPRTRRSQICSPIVISSSKRKMKSSAETSIAALDQKGVKR